MEWIGDQKYYIKCREHNKNYAQPCLFAQRGRDKIQDEPGCAKRDDADKYHAERVDKGKMFLLGYHGYRIEQCPEVNLYPEKEKAAEAAVADVAEPQQAHDIYDCAADKKRYNENNSNTGHKAPL